MSRVPVDGGAWPRELFWDYSVALYGRPGVEAACLELQQRHRIDVNLVLLCLWLGERGTALDGEALARLCHAADRWQLEVVRPLRNLRRRLKGTARRCASRTASRATGRRLPRRCASGRSRWRSTPSTWSRCISAASRRHWPASAAAGPALAGANLRHYWRFDRRDHKALRTLLEQAFAQAGASELDDGLRWLDGAQD